MSKIKNVPAHIKKIYAKSDIEKSKSKFKASRKRHWSNEDIEHHNSYKQIFKLSNTELKTIYIALMVRNMDVTFEGNELLIMTARNLATRIKDLV